MVKKETTEESSEREGRTTIFDLSRKMMLAGIGAAVLAQEEIERFANRMVERGEIAEKDARKLVKEILDRREKMERDRRAEETRSQPSVATKADIEALTAKIADLNKKLEELKKQQGE